jgi:Arc/MetJ-type ribon-helix-helix transcriptional regulator
MEVTLPADLREQVEHELASGRYHSQDELIEQAVRDFLNQRQRRVYKDLCKRTPHQIRRTEWRSKRN